MTEFLQLVVAGISLGSIYSLLGLGFVVVYRASGVINFAQGAMLLVAAYLVSWFTVDAGLPFAIAVVLVMAVMAAAGVALYVAMLRPVAGSPLFVPVMVTLGISTALVATVEAVFGPTQRTLGDPWGSAAVSLGAVRVNVVQVWGIATAAVLVGAYFYLDRRTRLGRALRATAADQEAALAVGVPIFRMHVLAWSLAGVVAVGAGVFLAAFPNSPNLTLGDAALRAFPAIVLGGLASPAGAIVGGLAIGLVELMTAGYAPSWLGNNVSGVAPYVALMLVLLVRPYGLIGGRPVERV